MTRDEPDPASGPYQDRRDHKGLVAALGVAIALTLGVFVYLWVAHDLPGSAWLLPLVWVPLMVWHYYGLRRGGLDRLAIVIFTSSGASVLTFMAVFSQAGETAAIVVGMTAFVIFAALIAAGAYMTELTARRDR